MSTHAGTWPPTRSTRLIGQSAVVEALQREMLQVARSSANVLITGESGAGKEVVARGIHAHGPRASHTFVAVNCAGLPETLLESELFGHVKGSFTGAFRDVPGRLEAAHGGTLFLDEVGDMPPRMQSLLLRFLETGEIQRVGAEGHHRRLDVRVIAATNGDLREMASEGTFREDLYFRLGVFHLLVPPLRERREDIPLLVAHFLGQYATTHPDGHPLTVQAEALRALMAYPWPGNVRELENMIERLVVTIPGTEIGVHHLPLEIRTPEHIPIRQKPDRRRTIAEDLYDRIVEQRESFWSTVYPLFMNREITRGHVREVVRRGLEEARGNYKIVARLFNMEPRDYKRFLNFLRKHDCQIPFTDYRG